MLAEMRIQGLGVIDDATLELDPGLTVLTGETGAGKTMVVTGLDAALRRPRRGVPGGGRGAAGRRRGPVQRRTRAALGAWPTRSAPSPTTTAR